MQYKEGKEETKFIIIYTSSSIVINYI